MEHKKILIVEDDRDVVEVLRIILEGESFEVKATFTGREGLFLVERESPDLIILDLLLPDIDGVKICDILKNNPRYQNIPIIVLTALSRKMEEKIFAEEKKSHLRVEGYLDKPVNPGQLLTTVRKFLR